MSTGDHQLVEFNTHGGKVAFQAGNVNNHGILNFNQQKQDLLDRLPYVARATFNHYDRQHEPTCYPNTRVAILDEIYECADAQVGQGGQYIVWLNGWAGTGKSTIARTVAREYYKRGRLGASYFFSKGEGDMGTANKFVTTIAWQLANLSSRLKTFICDALEKDRDIANKSLADQWRQLISIPLSKIEVETCQLPYILVIDALDECEENNIGTIVRLLTETTSIRAMILITSRPNLPSSNIIAESKAGCRSIVLHDVKPEIVNEDIFNFLAADLAKIQQEQELEPGWPGKDNVQALVGKAGGLFIWAATASRFISDGTYHADSRLGTILKSDDTCSAPEKKLNSIYLTVLQSSIPSSHSEEERSISCSLVRYILGSIVCLSSQLPPKSLYALLGIKGKNVHRIMKNLRAIIHVPERSNEQTDSFRLHHHSLRDFLLSPTRCIDDNFHVEERQIHRMLCIECVHLLSMSLRQDICDLKHPGVVIQEVSKDRVQRSLSPEVQYACLHWVKHLDNSCYRIHDEDFVHQLLNDHVLHWLEALGWIGNIHRGFLAIISLASNTSLSECPRFYDLIQDIKQFVQYNKGIMEQAPLQIYLSALAFAPRKSILRGMFGHRALQWLEYLPDVKEDWGGVMLHTLEGHSDRVTAFAFSNDQRILASGSSDKSIKLWDLVTGQCLQTLAVHEDPIKTISFSEDGGLLATESGRTVCLWDPSTGNCLHKFQCRLLVGAVTFSEDGETLIFISTDCTTQCWNLITKQFTWMFKGQYNPLVNILLSKDKRTLVSRRGLCDIKLLTLGTKSCKCKFGVDGDELVVKVALSDNGKVMALVLAPRYRVPFQVKLFDTATGHCFNILQFHVVTITAIALSPDNTTIALALHDAIKFCDITTGTMSRTFNIHGELVWTIAFSPDGSILAYGSSKVIHLCDLRARQNLEAYENRVNAVAISADGRMMASCRNNTIHLWDPTNRKHLKTLEGHDGDVGGLSFSEKTTMLASTSGKTIKLWNLPSGKCLHTLEGHRGAVNSISFSKYAVMLASAASDCRIWDTRNGQCVQILRGDKGTTFHRAVFSTLGSVLATAANDGFIRLWDVDDGECTKVLNCNAKWVQTIAFHPTEYSILASASALRVIKIWDILSGHCLQTIEGNHYIEQLFFSNDGQYLNTERGGSYHVVENPASALYVAKSWILQGQRKLLWIPHEYRLHASTCLAVHDNTVALQSSSGLAILRFIPL